MKTYKVILGLIAAIFVLLLSQIGGELMGSLFHLIGLQTGFCNIIAGVMYPLITYLLLKLLADKFLKTDVKKFRIPHIEVKMKWLIIGFVLPVVVKSIFLLMPGEFVSSGMDNNKIFTTLSAGIVFTGFAAGFVEEMVFRGIIMGLLKERWNTKVAIIVPSVLFASVHLIGMNFTALSCVLVFMAGTMVGVMFSLITLESNSVWNSGTVHAIWNIVIIGGGLSIGETADEYSVMTYVLKSKSFALTGGEFGIESSVIAFMGYVIVAIIALFMIKKNAK